jgi:hypothetical protein
MMRRRSDRHSSEPPEFLSIPGWGVAAVELGGIAVGAAAGAMLGAIGAVVGPVWEACQASCFSGALERAKNA